MNALRIPGIAGAAVALVALAGCGSSDSSSSTSSAKEHVGDASAKVACNDYSKLSDDQSDGVLRHSELRKGLKKVHKNADLSDNDKLQTAATRSLKAATNRDTDALKQWTHKLVKVCDKVQS